MVLTASALTSAANIINAKFIKEAIGIRGVAYVGTATVLIGMGLVFFLREKRLWPIIKSKEEKENEEPL